MRAKYLFALTLMMSIPSPRANADLALVERGESRTAIYVPARIMQDDVVIPQQAPYEIRHKETDRRKVRESVKDLAHYLEKISGAKVVIHERPPQKDEKGSPILIGEYAAEHFSPIQISTPYKQGWRMTVSKDAVGLQGESDEATSYAIYELLDRLGCRWFMPGDLGEVIPTNPNILLSEEDVTSVPSTASRNIWYGDDAFKRRNRLGGFAVRAGHALEFYVTDEQRKQHPDWAAVIDGKPHESRLKWSHPDVAAAIADSIISRLDKQYEPSVSISPDDGGVFDDSDDRALDAGDWDPTAGQVSITDRYIVLCNRIAERVAKKYPDVRFGFLAYVQYTRPPVREALHPNLIPALAPITYCRAHCAVGDHTCASKALLREIVEGWGKVAKQLTYRNYMFHLAEVTAPYPMIRQMSQELPLLYKNHVVFWQPETIPNFEEVLPGMWLSLRMAWNSGLKPDEVLTEFYDMFYGKASPSMRRYWEFFDKVWTESPGHAGSLWSYNRRFTPDVLAEARRLMDNALSEAATPIEYQRVLLQDHALRQFERFMRMRADLNEGRLAKLDQQCDMWYGTQLGLAEEYKDNYAFSKVRWGSGNVGSHYFKRFVDETYRDAARMAQTHTPVSKPLRQWRYAFLNNPDLKPGLTDKAGLTVQQGEDRGWSKADFADESWKLTDVGMDTWDDLGVGDAFGTMWYRQRVSIPKLAPGKRVYLWISSTDGNVKVFVNGLHIPFVNRDGERTDMAGGYAEPFKFDVTDAIQSGVENQITIAGTRTSVNELGTGGLLGPAYLFQEK